MTMFMRSPLRRAATLLGVLGSAAMLAAPAPAVAADAIRVATLYQATTLDPMRSASSGNLEVYGQLYARLLRRDPDSGELQPGLAESWDISPDGKTYTFRLRDAKFSDGSALTADDVAFSLERVRSDKESAYPAPLSAVESVTATDPKTVTVNLKSSFAPFLANVEIWNMGIVSKADVEKRGAEKAFTEAPLASGPYMVQDWKPNERLVLAPNPNYWREGYPKSDATVEFIEVASPETRVAMLKAGEADAVRGVQWSQIADLKATEGVDMRLEPSTTIYMVLLNSKREPFSDTKGPPGGGARVDNKAVTQAVTLGNAEPANTTLPRVDFHDDAYPGIAYDPAKAKQLLQESGMEGKEVQILATPAPPSSSSLFSSRLSGRRSA
jgi:peptide/nickel transport system substrate-binding protein